MVALMSPEDSWVARWQKISKYLFLHNLTERKITKMFYNFTDRFTKGIYAISVAGRLPPNFVREMKARGIPYRPRDTAFK